MPCFDIRTGYRSRTVNASGKRSIVFNKRDGFSDLEVKVPCGQCIGCRLERSRQWAMRCVLEASLHEENSFLTLTYSDDNLPPHGSLRVSDFQSFMKRLRFQYSDRQIRFFHCGEYGENYGRPHYHALLFGFDLPDKVFWKEENGNKYYVSATLGTVLVDHKPVHTGTGLWHYGNSIIGEVTFESAAYVARYVTKKITGPWKEFVYERVDEETGEIVSLTPEYTTMSRRPGIGAQWFEKYKTDVYPHDFVVLRNKKLRPPKYYDQLLEKCAKQEFERIKANRKEAGEAHSENNTFPRMRVREEIQLMKADKLIRRIEK